jgi:PRC-barrel domain
MTPTMSPSSMSSSDMSSNSMSSSTSTSSGQGFVLDSKLTGSHLKNQQEEDLGTISNLIINPDTGHIRYAVVNTGGKKVVIPWSAINAASTTAGMAPNLTVNVSKEKLSNAPKFDPNNLEDLYNRTTEEPIFTYYEMVWFPDVSSADEEKARGENSGSSSSTDSTATTSGAYASPTSTPFATASPH